MVLVLCVWFVWVGVGLRKMLASGAVLVMVCLDVVLLVRFLCGDEVERLGLGRLRWVSP